MFIHKTKNGYYYVFYTDKNTGKRNKITCGTRIKADAIKFLSNLETNLKVKEEKFKTLKSAVYYISDLQTEVIKYVSENMSKSTVKVYKIHFKNVLSILGNVPIKTITFKDIERYKSVRAETVSKASVNKDLTTMKSAFNLALKFNWINTNPAKNVKKIIISEREILCFSKEQTKLIINNTKHKVLKNAIIFGLLTGCRLNEILYLQWKDVNFQENIITIRNKVNFKTKTGKNRNIPISENLLSMLKGLLSNENDSNIIKFINPDNYVFANVNGYAHNKDYITKRFKRVLRELNFEEKFHFHCLRHTFITQLIKAGVNINYIREIAGHTNIQTTMRYIHISTNDLRDAVNKVSVY